MITRRQFLALVAAVVASSGVRLSAKTDASPCLWDVWLSEARKAGLSDREACISWKMYNHEFNS
jgi:hypothetical protein